MKTYKIFDNANQHSKLNGNTECNNNNDKNDKPTMNNGKVTLTSNKASNDMKHGFKHDSNTSAMPSTEIIDDKCNKSDVTSASKRYAIENFLQSNASNAAVAAAETARNGFLAAAAAAQQYTPFNIFSPYLKDMFLAAQLISRGYYQPAGPLINSHLVGGPQNLTKQPIASSLESEGLPQSQQSTSEGPSHTFRYPSAAQIPSQQIPSATPLPNHYSRPLHPMHCPTYSPAPYYPYGQHPRDMCYSPPYQTGYYTPKVYSATAYRPYMPSTSYYQTPPTELYEHPGQMHQPSVIPPPTQQSVGQQQTTQTIDTTNPPIQPQPQQMQSPNTQLVPSIPSAQHIEHYSPYYTPGYSHSGGQCFTPPFMDSSPFPNSCPCPIQPYPKNVHTGPLIGSQSDKGPGQKQNINNNNKTTIINTSANKSSNKTPIQCKTENIIDDSINLNSIVKPEIIHSYDHRMDVSTCKNKNLDQKIALVPQHHPNFTVNSKILEQPEMSISPARGSIGPGVAKTQASAAQPLELSGMRPLSDRTISQSTDQTPVTSRRARVGKTMAREMMFQSHTNLADSLAKEIDNDSPAKEHIFASTPIKVIQEEESVKIPHFMSGTVNGRLIKQEHMKKENDDDIMIISSSEANSSDVEKPSDLFTIDLSMDKTINECTIDSSTRKRSIDDTEEIIDLDADTTMANVVKRRKILEFHKNPNKKSPPNSYKSLIKPSETKAYLCKADTPTLKTVNIISNDKQFDDEQSKSMEMNEISSSDQISEIIIDDSNDPISIEDDILTQNSMNCAQVNNKDNLNNSIVRSQPSIADEFPHELTMEKQNFMSNLDLTNDNVAKGYCSDNEVLSRKQKRLKNKINSCEGRSRSESKKSEKKSTNKAVIDATDEKSKSKIRKTSRDRSTSSAKSKERTTKSASGKQISKQQQQQQQQSQVGAARLSNTTNGKTKDSKSTKAKDNETKTNSKKSKDSTNRAIKSKRDNSKGRSIASQSVNSDNHMNDRSIDNEVALLDNETHNNNNNNCILIDKNNQMDFDDEFDIVDQLKPMAKKSKSRGSKFSNKKRHRMRSSKPVEEIIIPRQTLSTPRWSNGWNWLGEPFQGKIFLNSDDHQVVRTRYPAMIHDCGDTIKPGDCVLLRAGSKKNELPYVAKVASLWENPEDGEMMMSAFWYYRPEHTEQGRQPHDCPDEVFASKHQDHNSVACIEDKCYVLTFNEYCRYRKTIRAIEQGIEEVPSIVPALKYSTGREVPLNTNSELILFCRRVYEFRLKRLIKNPS